MVEAKAPALTLDREELASLTSYEQVKRMCAWLDANGWAYLPPSRRGDIPKVSRAYAEERMAGRQPIGAEPTRRRLGPSLDWMVGTTAS